MIIKEDFTFISFQDQLPIHALVMKPETPVKAVVQLVHGMSEHKERYVPFMEYVCKQGYVCVIHDHRGHGESVKSKEDVGYFYEKSGMYMIEDAHQLTYEMKKRYPDLPYYLFGHSMGSLVVRGYTKKFDYELDGLIVCGSPSKNPAALAGQLLVQVMSKFKNDRYRSPLIQKMAFGTYNKKFPEAKSPNSWICSDEAVVQAYDADDLCGFVFTLNGFENLFRLMRYVYDDDKWLMRNKKLPILFIAGKEDPCIASEMQFEQAHDFMKFVGYRHVQAKLYPGMRHEILNEPGHLEVYEDVLQFLAQQGIQK